MLVGLIVTLTHSLVVAMTALRSWGADWVYELLMGVKRAGLLCDGWYIWCLASLVRRNWLTRTWVGMKSVREEIW